MQGQFLGNLPTYIDGQGNIHVDTNGAERSFEGDFEGRDERRERRQERREDRKDRREDRKEDRRDRRSGKVPAFPSVSMANGGGAAADVEGTVNVQYNFDCDDATATYSSGVLVKQIKFGDQIILDEPAGVPAENILNAASLRDNELFAGLELDAGLAIFIRANIPASGSLKVTFKGQKPAPMGCR